MRIVFDLDGTLCNVEHRLHFIHRPKPDWHSFYRACIYDIPVVPLVNLCSQLILAGNDVDIWSGRSEEVQEQTENWLKQHGLLYRGLRMRGRTDYRQDSIVKMEWLEALPKDLWPEIVFDDRQQMVDAWRTHGIVCCQVASGNF